MILSSEESIASVARIPFGLRCSNAIVSYVKYLGCLLIPSKLFLLYPYPEGGIPLWVSGGSLLFLVSMTEVAVRLFKERPYLIIGWLWYLSMLFPMIGILQAGSQASADRYTYLSQIGVVIAGVWFFGEHRVLHRHRGVAWGLAILMLSVFMVASRVQVSHWRDSVSLWSRTLACVEPHSVAHNNLGIAFKQEGRLEEARHHLKRAISLRPTGVEAYNNLAGACVQEEDWVGAEPWYLLALEKEPYHAVIHQNYAVVLVNLGRANDAIREFKVALEINPDLLGACKGLVKVLAQTGDVSEAILVLNRMIERHPKNASLHYNLGILFESKGLLDSAVARYEAAIQLEPDVSGARDRLNALISKRVEGESFPNPLGE